MQRFSLHTLLAMATLVGLLAFLGWRQPLLAQSANPEGDPVIGVVGDIASCYWERDSLTAYLMDSIPGPLLLLGDNVYEVGSIDEFRDCFAPDWGKNLERIYPVPGNHEYGTGQAAGYFTYFGDRATPREPGCTSGCDGYYSFNIGTWHVVALNSEIPNTAGSPQEQWLRADLAANPAVCTMAMWHRPTFSSGQHNAGAAIDLYKALYDYGADVVLVGHDHDYERFAPQSPSGVLEYERGIRQFVVGTGGADLRDYRFIQPNSEVRNSETWGVLKMTLHADSYDWEFQPIPGQTFTDSGSSPCVTVVSVPPAPAGAAAPAANATADNSAPAATSSTGSAAAVPADGMDYTVAAGDTLSLIAIRYGLDWEVLAEVNNLGDGNTIEVGQVIRLPGVSAGAAAATPAPAVAATGTTTGTTTNSAATGNFGSYTVKAGDTLSSIALEFDLTWTGLATANNMSDTDFLQIGQVLRIPGQAAAATTTQPAATATPRPATGGVALPTATPAASLGASTTTTTTVTATATATRPPSGKTYTVADGDTVISIALANNVDWQEMLEVNGLTASSILQVGQVLKLP